METVLRKYYRLGGCPRCHGDILVDKAFDEPVEACIQCGYYRYLDESDGMKEVEPVTQPQQ